MMHLISWNINGLRSVWQKGSLQALIKDYQPDIICLQEIKAQADQIELDLDYQMVWNSASRKGYSGTLVLSRLPIKNSSFNFSDDLANKYQLKDQFGNTNDEGRVLSLEFDKFHLVTVYTPNSKGDLSRLRLRFKDWDPAFAKHCRRLAKSKPVLICGDFNVAHQAIDLARPKQNQGKHGFTDEERQGFSHLLAQDLIDTFRHCHPQKTDAYTWWTHWANARAKNVGWRIDYWLASQKLSNLISDSLIYSQVMGSDHCPIGLKIKL